MRILLSGGGTGGHVYPILAVVDALKQNSPAAEPSLRSKEKHHPDNRAKPASQDSSRAKLAARRPVAEADNAVELHYIGEAGGIEESLVRQAGISFSAVETGQIRGRAPWVVARSLVRMRRGITQCATVIREFRPDVVFITGGYVTAPVAWAARRWPPRIPYPELRGIPCPELRGIPLLIYLPDLTPGLAIRLTSRLATKVAVSFPEVTRYFPGKAVVTGYPVRSELLAADRAAAHQALGLQPDLPTLLVFGGSRGAHSINQALIAALPDLLPRCQIVHISGQLDWPWVQKALARDTVSEGSATLRKRYHPYPYLHEEMTQALVAADLVVARAGASVLGEFPAVGLPSILVPYPFAGQHQVANATYLAERGAALVLADSNLPSHLTSTVLDLIGQPKRLKVMAKAARALARQDAAQNIVRELRGLAKC